MDELLLLLFKKGPFLPTMVHCSPRAGPFHPNGGQFLPMFIYIFEMHFVKKHIEIDC